MVATPRRIQRIYLVLVAGNTLAASIIWGINTLFLLDAGLNNLEAFAANAFFTVGISNRTIPTVKKAFAANASRLFRRNWSGSLIVWHSWD